VPNSSWVASSQVQPFKKHRKVISPPPAAWAASYGTGKSAIHNYRLAAVSIGLTIFSLLPANSGKKAEKSREIDGTATGQKT
jgi:hypothetical protein